MGNAQHHAPFSKSTLIHDVLFVIIVCSALASAGALPLASWRTRTMAPPASQSLLLPSKALGALSTSTSSSSSSSSSSSKSMAAAMHDHQQQQQRNVARVAVPATVLSDCGRHAIQVALSVAAQHAAAVVVAPDATSTRRPASSWSFSRLAMIGGWDKRRQRATFVQASTAGLRRLARAVLISLLTLRRRGHNAVRLSKIYVLCKY